MTEFPEPPPRADLPSEGDYSRPPAATGSDPVGVAAIVVGCIGLVAFGIVLAIVTAGLAGIAGQRARERRTSFENAYIAFALAALDGVVWIVLHMLFEISFIAG
jgi:hypothetical protein